jgi:hypothetical protein
VTAVTVPNAVPGKLASITTTPEFAMTRPNRECREMHRPAEVLYDAELDAVSGGMMPLMATVTTNLANMRHEMLKSVAQNLRA